jgi:NAD(P)H-nitrite reductase large subunit
VTRYVIIGSGAAGIAAAESIRRQDSKASILMLGEEMHGYYSRPGLAYYLTGEIGEKQLFPFNKQDFEHIGLHLLHAQVKHLDPHEHYVALQNGRQVPYDRLLIATGARAATAKVPGIDMEGVVKLDNLDDARRILKLARKARTAVVVGGGITALELVEGLRARGVRTHYFLRRERYWSNVLDETESTIVEHRLVEEGVKIHYHTDLAEILGKRGRVAGVLTADGKQVKCGLVAVAIGIRPRKELAEAAGLEVERGILVDEYLCSSYPDIFAAGDVAQVYDPILEKSILDSLWGAARSQGSAAGSNMAGGATPYHKPIAFNVTRLAGLTTTIIGAVGCGEDDDLMGIARGDSETWRELPDVITAQDNFEVNRLRLSVGAHTLRGAIVMGDQTLSRPVHQLVSEQVDITTIREQLLAPGAPIADLIADFYTQWNKVHETRQP